MSSGENFVDPCADPFPMSFEEARELLRFPIVARMMQRLSTYTINSTEYDVVHVAGSSVGTDPMCIYIDRDLKKWKFSRALSKMEIDCGRFLILHEHIERAVIAAVESYGAEAERLMIALKMGYRDDELYRRAHGVATACELHSVWISHGDSGCRSYCKFMTTQIKHPAEIFCPPPNLYTHFELGV